MQLQPIFIYSANDDTNNYVTQGEGSLPDLTYGKATGGLSDQTTLTFQYPIDGVNVDLIDENKIVLVKINEFQDEQRMRITSVKKSLSGRQYEIKAEPIFNDIRRYFIPTVNSGVATNPLDAFNLMRQNSVPAIPSKFIFRSDLTSSGVFNLEAVNALEAVGGTDGSMLDTFGGEYIRDNLTLYAYKTFGALNVTQLVYGKNIQGLDMEINTENIVVGIFPFAKYNTATGEGDTQVTLTLDEKILRYDTADTYPNGRILPVDFSQEFEDEETPTQARLRQLANTYMAQAVNYNKSKPLINVKIDFLELSKFSEYYNFQQLSKVGLGDTATVYYPPLAIDVETRVIKYEYDIVKQQYSNLELGQVKANFYQKLQDNIKDVENKIQDNDFSGIYQDIQDAVQDASDKITGNQGGNVLIAPPEKPEEILIMDTDDKNTAVDVLRLNNSGLGFSRDGYNGVYRTAWTIDGQFNADFITAGTLTAININGVNISGSVFKSEGADFITTIDNGAIEFTRVSNGTKAGKLSAELASGNSDLTYTIDPESLGGGVQVISPFLDTLHPLNAKALMTMISTNVVSWTTFNANQISLNASSAYSSTTSSKTASIDLNSGAGTGSIQIRQKSDEGSQSPLFYVDIRNGVWSGNFGTYQLASLQVTGSKNSLVRTKQYGYRLLNAYETPEYLFATYNKVTTDENGSTEVMIDPVFLETINTDSENYHVFTSGYGNYNTWVTDLKTDRFTIHTSEPNCIVSWNLVAYRLDYEDFYLETPISNTNKSTTMKTKTEPIPESPLDVMTNYYTIPSHPDKEEKR